MYMDESYLLTNMGELSKGIRICWGTDVLGRCQWATGQLVVFNRGTFSATFEELARLLPAPSSASERLFLSDRLRSLTRTAGFRFHATFHQRFRDRSCHGWSETENPITTGDRVASTHNPSTVTPLSATRTDAPDEGAHTRAG
jgi:hypothetical protein